MLFRGDTVGARADSASRSGRAAAELIEARLTPLLGRHMAANAMRTFARTAVAKKPTDLDEGDLPALLRALRPMLRVLCGADTAQSLLDGLRQELGIDEIV